MILLGDSNMLPHRRKNKQKALVAEAEKKKAAEAKKKAEAAKKKKQAAKKKESDSE